MKHGMRIAPGGSSLSFGVEPSPGESPESMKVLSSSRYGSRFFQSQKVGQTSHHMRIQRTSLNWSALAMAQRLALVSMSINNIISALRVGHGLDASGVDFQRPISPELFEDAFREDVGVRSIRFDSVVKIQPVDEVSRAELLEELRSRPQSSAEDNSD